MANGCPCEACNGGWAPTATLTVGDVTFVRETLALWLIAEARRCAAVLLDNDYVPNDWDRDGTYRFPWEVAADG